MPKIIKDVVRGFISIHTLLAFSGLSVAVVAGTLMVSDFGLSIEQVSRFISDVGFPVFLIVVLVFGIWNGVRSAWSIIVPGITDWLQAMRDREEALKESSARSVRLLEEVTQKTIDMQSASLELQKSNHNLLTEVITLTEKNKGSEKK